MMRGRKPPSSIQGDRISSARLSAVGGHRGAAAARAREGAGRDSKKAEAEAMSTPTAPSLKGIVNTNVDPNLCAICSDPLKEPQSDSDDPCLSMCCGKQECSTCYDSGASYDQKADRCLLCNATQISRIGLVKKQAKKGHAWGQYHLGIKFHEGNGVAKSEFEATRWFRKAAAQGHPDALVAMSWHCFDGIGCKRNMVESRKYAERAMLLRASLTDASKQNLALVAAKYIETHSTDMMEAGKAILIPLATDGVSLAQYALGVYFYNRDEYGDAKPWLTAAALQGDHRSAFYAADCCRELREHPQQRFWFIISSKCQPLFADDTELETAYMELVDLVSNHMCRLRDKCGGCGAVLDGKTRKICKGCETYCYCDRTCQKLHWNRPKGGHRADCLEVFDLKKKVEQKEEREE